MATRVFICGYYGFDNAGDEAILSALLAELRRLQPDLDATVVSGSPVDTSLQHAVKAVPWADPAAMAEAVQYSDLVIVGGGGLFHDYTGFIPTGLFTEGNWGLGFHATAALLGALFKRPVALCGLGIGPIFSTHGKRFTRTACEAAGVITVRDEASQSLLAEIGVPRERVLVTADPAFALELPPVFPAHNPWVREPRLAVVVRPWSFGVHPAFWEGQVAETVDLYLERTGGFAVLIPFQGHPGEQEDDLAVAQRIYDRMKRQDQAWIIREKYSPENLAAMLALSDIVLGMRLHALVFSILAHVPFVALSYDPKVTQLARLAGQDPFVMDLGAVDARALDALLERAMAAKDDIRPRFETLAEHLAGRARANARIALQALGTGDRPLPESVRQLLGDATLAFLRANRALRGR